MTVRLMNAAVMPREGTYRMARLTPDEFALMVRKRSPKSYIGYPECARILEKFCRVPIPLNRESTPVEDGDVLLIARLIFRVGNPAAKGLVRATLDDYEFFVAEYSAT